MCCDDVVTWTFFVTGYLKKRIVTRSVEWVERYVTLSSEELLISNGSGGEVRDNIVLLDITTCELYSGDEQSLMGVDNLHRMAKARGASTMKTIQGSMKAVSSKIGRKANGERGAEASLSLAAEGSDVQGEMLDATRPASTSPQSGPRLKASKSIAGAEAAKVAIATGKPTTHASFLLEDFKSKLPEDHSLEGLQWSHTLRIHTEKFARTYYLRAASEDVIQGWIEAVNKARAAAWKAHEKGLELTALQRFRQKIRRFYDSASCQGFVAMVLMANFAISIIEAEHAAHGMGADALIFYDMVDLAFSLFYIAELMVNLYGHWLWDFLSNPWSVFDFVIVSVSVVELAYVYIFVKMSEDPNASGGKASGIAAMRLLRVFRC
jgi:hypothetical protein